MPADTGIKPAFWATYGGLVLGAILPMALGALLGLVAANDVVAGLIQETGAAATLIIVIFSLSIACSNAMNLYCGTLSVITIAQTFLPKWRPHAVARASISAVLFAAGTVVALAASDNFMQNYENFVLLLLYVLIPWSSINLVDYYLIHKGNYDVGSFFAANGGIYGKFNREALLCYVGGILIQLPFVSNALYTGPVAKALGGGGYFMARGHRCYLACRLRPGPARRTARNGCARRSGLKVQRAAPEEAATSTKIRNIHDPSITHRHHRLWYWGRYARRLSQEVWLYGSPVRACTCLWRSRCGRPDDTECRESHSRAWVAARALELRLSTRSPDWTKLAHRQAHVQRASQGRLPPALQCAIFPCAPGGSAWFVWLPNCRRSR